MYNSLLRDHEKHDKNDRYETSTGRVYTVPNRTVSDSSFVSLAGGLSVFLVFVEH
jgi:hypothetical protein